MRLTASKCDRNLHFWEPKKTENGHTKKAIMVEVWQQQSKLNWTIAHLKKGNHNPNVNGIIWHFLALQQQTLIDVT